MTVLMVLQHVNFFRNVDTVLRELHLRGHQGVVLHGTPLHDDKQREKLEKKKEKLVFLGRGLNVAQSEVPGVTVGYRIEPAEPWQVALRVGRQVVNRAIYMRKSHPSPERVADMLDRDLPEAWIDRMQTRLGRAVFSRRFPLAAWRAIEAASPPSPDVVAVLREVNPDVVLVSPTIWPKNPLEADYIHAAHSLGIPTIGYVNSWDNLTSKGTIHVLPDVLMVWNEPIAQEAVELHDVPPGRVRIVGAPHLDRFFALAPTQTHDEACAQMGAPARPYLVYLCSSRTLMATEVDVVDALATALAARFPAGAPTLVVRPHPTNPGTWDNYDRPGVVVYPRQGDQADCPEAWQEYFNQLVHAACVFGLNTTAFLESVVADRPCLTIVAEQFHGAQGRTGHFRHLLKGDFMEVSRDVTEVADRVARILDGADEKAQGRRFFTEWFLRPCGVGVPATDVVTDVIESMARPGVATSPIGVRRRDLVPGLAPQEAGR